MAGVTYQSGRGRLLAKALPADRLARQSPETGIRYFSGIGTYHRSLTLPRSWTPPQGRLSLDLGQVHDVADVTVNGHRAGVGASALSGTSRACFTRAPTRSASRAAICGSTA
jgi:hypothetical protein